MGNRQLNVINIESEVMPMLNIHNRQKLSMIECFS